MSPVHGSQWTTVLWAIKNHGWPGYYRHSVKISGRESHWMINIHQQNHFVIHLEESIEIQIAQWAKSEQNWFYSAPLKFLKFSVFNSFVLWNIYLVKIVNKYSYFENYELFLRVKSSSFVHAAGKQINFGISQEETVKVQQPQWFW